MKRTILHCDLNCFFASVEMLYNPELRDVPMAIAGDKESRHGIILAKNVLAKKAGVKTAETIGDALKKCPNLVLRNADYETYEYFSEKVRDLYYEYTDRIEPFGIDECWLDITESIPYFGSAQKIVDALLYRSRTEIGLTLSIGVSFNKIYAKLGSDLAKEDSYCKIDSLDDIRYLPASSLLGVGEKTGEHLKSYGIVTIGDIAAKTPDYLHSILGKFGYSLHRYACGLGNDHVEKVGTIKEEVKSISNSMTSSRDIYNMDDFKAILSIVCDSVAARLCRKGLFFKTVHLVVRNNKMKIRTMQTRLKENSDLSKEIFRQALLLFERNCDFSIPYRSIGVAVSDLSYNKESVQTDLFDTNPSYSLKQKKEELAIQEVRRRFGKDVIAPLRLYEDGNLSKVRNKNQTISERSKL